MIKTISHQIVSSFKVYLDYMLLDKLQAYVNKTTNLYPYTDPSYPNKAIYGSPYAQWVYNGSASGVVVPSGVSGGGFLARGQSGLVIDYKNGRIILNSGVSDTFTANISVSEVNTYVSTLPDDKLLAQTNFSIIPDLKPANTYLPPRQLVLPAIFIRLISKDNEPAMFGGGEWTDFNLRLSCIMTDNTKLLAVEDMLADLERRIVPLLDSSVLNAYNDLFDPSWDYASILENTTSYFDIQDIKMRFIENDEFTQKNNSLHVGIVNIKCRMLRFPRQ